MSLPMEQNGEGEIEVANVVGGDEKQEEVTMGDTTVNEGGESLDKDKEKVEDDAGAGVNSGDKIQDAEDDEMILVKTVGTVKQNRIYYIIAPWTMPTCIWTDIQDNIKWIGHPGKKLTEVVEQITDLLSRSEPSNILVLSLQDFIGNTNQDVIERVLDDITRKAMGSVHRLAWCCVFYVPQLERVWSRTTGVNQHIRLCNLNMNQAPCNLHKKMLVSVNKGRVFYIRPNLFTEWVNKTGVGETLNHAGLLRVKELVNIYCVNGFTDDERPPSQPVSRDVEPPPLFLSRGYSKNPQMMEFIRQSGLRQPSRPQSARGYNQQQEPGSRNRSLSSVGPPRNQDNRGRPRVKVQDNGLRWEEEDDLTVEERRVKRRLDIKNKLDSRRLGPDVDELAGRLRDLRLKGVKDSQRSRQREKNLEGKVRDLEREVNEKDRRIRDMKDRLRESRDSDRRNRDLKQENREKADKVRRLSGDLAEMRKEMEAWRTAYEKICEVVDGKRRRK